VFGMIHDMFIICISYVWIKSFFSVLIMRNDWFFIFVWI
jgi:hypothetical protein